MKKQTVDSAMEMLDDGIVKEAAKPRRFSTKATVAGVLAVALVAVGTAGVLDNTSNALLADMDKLAATAVETAEQLDYCDDEEAADAFETAMYYSSGSLTAVSLASGTVENPVEEALLDHAEEIEALRDRAEASSARLKAAVAEVREGGAKLTLEQKIALIKGRSAIRARVREIRRARIRVTAVELIKAKRDGDTEKLAEIYDETNGLIETRLEKLSDMLDRMDEISAALESGQTE